MKEFFSKKHTVRTTFIVLMFLVPFVLFSINSRFLPAQFFSRTAVTSTPMNAQNLPFTVIKTSPQNGEKDVYPGEITLSFTADSDIMSSDAFTFTMFPKPPYKWDLINSYPTREITAQIYGSLEPNTLYTMEVKDKNNVIIHTWSFTTSGEIPDSSSQLVREAEEEQIRQSYPLFHHVPFENDRFSIDYSDALTLTVQIKSAEVDMVKQEVTTWIKNHGVDPSTHKIIWN